MIFPDDFGFFSLKVDWLSFYKHKQLSIFYTTLNKTVSVKVQSKNSKISGVFNLNCTATGTLKTDTIACH